MAEPKTAISLNQYTLEILDRAEVLWPEFSGNRSAIIRKIIADWDRNRNEHGGKTSQTHYRLDRHERILQMICAKLGIDLEAINGHDITVLSDAG